MPKLAGLVWSSGGRAYRCGSGKMGLHSGAPTSWPPWNERACRRSERGRRGQIHNAQVLLPHSLNEYRSPVALDLARAGMKDTGRRRKRPRAPRRKTQRQRRNRAVGLSGGWGIGWEYSTSRRWGERNRRPSSIGVWMRDWLETKFYVWTLKNKIGVEIGGWLELPWHS